MHVLHLLVECRNRFSISGVNKSVGGGAVDGIKGKRAESAILNCFGYDAAAGGDVLDELLNVGPGRTGQCAGRHAVAAMI